MSKSWLVTALLLTSLAQARPLASCDGHYQGILSRDQETFSLRQDGRTLWTRKCPGTPLALSRSGRVLFRTPTGVLLVLEQSIPVNALDGRGDITHAWFSQKGDSLFTLGEVPQHLWLGWGTPFGRGASQASPSQLLAQLDNPESPKDELVLYLGASLPRHRRVAGLHPWLQWARQGTPQARQLLDRAQPRDRDEWELWLRAQQLAGEACLRRGLERAWSELTWGGDLESAPWDWLGESLQPLATRALLNCPPGHKATNLLEILNLSDAVLPPAYTSTLERLAHSPPHQVSAIHLLVRSSDPRRTPCLLALLNPRLDREAFLVVVGHFCENADPQAVEGLVASLRQPGWTPAQRRRLQDALYFQTRLDFGADPQGWEQWPEMSPEQRRQARLQQPSRGKEASILLKGQLGQLQATDLQDEMRRLRTLPFSAEIAPGGRWLISQDKAHALTPLAADHSIAYTGSGQWLPDPERPAGWAWGGGQITPVQLSPYSPGADHEFPSEEWGQPQSFSDSLLVLSHGLADAQSTKGLWHNPKTWVSQACRRPPRLLVHDGEGRSSVWDYQSGHRLLFGRILKASRGFELLVEHLGQGRLRAIDEFGRSRGPVLDAESFEISPDGSRLLVQWDGRMRLIDPLSGKTLAEQPGEYHTACFSQDGQTLALQSSDRLEYRRLADLSLLSSAQGLLGPNLTMSRDGNYLSQPDYEDTTWLWETQPRVHQLPPGEHQDLFAELWTGCRLRAGLALPLTPEQYQQRRLQWRTLTGQDWSLSPDYPAPLPSPWLATRPLLLLLPLPPLAWWLRRRALGHKA